jgi:hypothetical protein
MLSMRRRIESLERAIVPLSPPGPPEVMQVDFVDSERKVVDTLLIEMAPVRPSNGRRWRAARDLPPVRGGR